MLCAYPWSRGSAEKIDKPSRIPGCVEVEESSTPFSAAALSASLRWLPYEALLFETKYTGWSPSCGRKAGGGPAVRTAPAESTIHRLLHADIKMWPAPFRPRGQTSN